MRGVASTQISPGAQTCVVIGAVDESVDLDLRGYRAVLWFTREQSRAQPALFDATRTHIEPVSRLDTSRATSSVDELIRRDALHLPSVFVTNEAAADASESYVPVLEAIFAQFESHLRARTTRQQDGFRWQSHLLANLSAYAHRRVPQRWANALAGLPAIVCGSGPSLDSSLSSLRYASEQAVVFSADSALRALARIGVTADFAVSVDARKTPEKCLTPGHASAGRVILAGISPSDWQYSVSEHKLHFLSGRQVTEDRLGELGIEKTAVTVEDNCGITALVLALHLGCGPIYLFGMDHAVDSKDPSRWHHRNGPEDADAQIGFSPQHEYPMVPGNYQPEIATPLFREWRALDAKCAALPQGFVHNITDRGARLRNTTVIHPSSFVLPDSSEPKESRLAMLATPDSIRERDWRKTRDHLVKLATQASDMIAAARTAFDAGHTQRGAELLARPFRDKRFNVLFGNYSLRIVPHLVHFNQVDAALWPQLLDECSELLTLGLNLR